MNPRLIKYSDFEQWAKKYSLVSIVQIDERTIIFKPCEHHDELGGVFSE
jgi:hypothetical protein